MQERSGIHGKVFRIYKFRTMTNGLDKQGHPLGDEQRLTTFGIILRKWSLDELPQLWNVFRGDISLVGPRPLLTKYLSRYSKEQAQRHEVRPGLTGWAQINGRNALSWEQKFEYDLWYVKNRSFVLYFKILFLTIGKILRHQGVSSEQSATMPEFLGNKK